MLPRLASKNVSSQSKKSQKSSPHGPVSRTLSEATILRQAPIVQYTPERDTEGVVLKEALVANRVTDKKGVRI